MKLWWKAAGLRAVRTFAQALLATIPATIAINLTTDWMGVGLVAINIVGSAALAAVFSLLTSVATNLPELKCDEPSE